MRYIKLYRSLLIPSLFLFFLGLAAVTPLVISGGSLNQTSARALMAFGLPALLGACIPLAIRFKVWRGSPSARQE